MALDLLINTSDPQQRGLIASILDGGIAPFPNFTRNDASVAITLQPVVPSATDTRSFDVDYTAGDTYQVSIGSADEAPTAGTFALEIDGVTTDLTALDFDVSAADLQTPLSLASVAGGNPAVTVTFLSDGVYQVDGATNGVLPTIAATATNLIPVCSAVVTVIAQGTVSTKGQQIIALVQQPAAYATPSTALPTASVTVSTEQAASSSLNKIIRIAFAAGTYGGLYSLSATVNSVTAVCGSVSPVASIGELSTVIGRHPQLRYNNASAADNFTVSTSGAAYLVEFIGNLAGPSDPSLAATNVSLLAPFGASGTISLNTVNMAKMFWAAGVDSLALTLSVVRTRTSGEVKTILSIPVTVPADIINAGSLTTLSVSGAVRYDISQSLSAAEKLQAVTNQGLNLTASKLLGQASSGGTGLPVSISLGTNLSMSGTTLSAQGDRYLTSSTTSLTIGNGSKSLTVGTGLAYTTQQDITIAYDSNNHMHATVTSYNSGTGAMVVDVQGKTGSGTYAVWTVNVGGIAASVIPAGGTTGQVLNKISNSDYAVQWGPTVTGTGTISTGTYTLTVANTASVSGTNTGDQTSVSGNAGTATTLQTTRTIGGSNFNGSANVTSFPSPGAIGGTTPAAGTFTTINGNTITAGTGILTLDAGSDVNFASSGQLNLLGYNFEITGDVHLFDGGNGFGITITGASAGSSVTLPASGTLLSTANLGTNVATFLATPSGANLASALTSALTVAKGGTGLTAGTSGGILAFTATGTIASSGLLAANALMIGGGAGVAPSTTTTGAGVLTALGIAPNASGGFSTLRKFSGSADGSTLGTITGISSPLVITVTGAAVGDIPTVSFPESASQGTALLMSAVAGTNTVTVIFYAAADSLGLPQDAEFNVGQMIYASIIK
jgi:hypothetical protein